MRVLAIWFGGVLLDLPLHNQSFMKEPTPKFIVVNAII